jgi:futalosine hydrolase
LSALAGSPRLVAMAASSAGRPTLLLVPTALEAARLETLGGWRASASIVETCGFGPIAAAARTAELVERLKPRRVLLVGIAGSYRPEPDAIGTALAFARVAIDGLGAGEGDALVPPARMGFHQHPTQPGQDELQLARPVSASNGEPHLLLTVCAASADADQAARRKRRHREALAEDMEGFGVALACVRARVPLCVVRGLSNQAGERDTARWRIDEALNAARTLALELLDSGADWEVQS